MHNKTQDTVGFPIFEKLFHMKKADLLVQLRTICSHRITSDLLDDNSEVVKETSNDIPVKIVVISYDVLVITPNGIEYRQEPGHFENIAYFNQNFKL